MKPPTDAKIFLTCGKYLLEFKSQLEQKFNKNDFWMMVIENLLQENQTYQSNLVDFRLTRSARDFQMASNLNWLSNYKYKNQKIIVWAANYHIAKYTDTSSSDFSKRLTSMGSYFTRDSLMQKNTFIIGFSSFSGDAGRLGVKDYTIAKPKLNGFETWIDNRFDYAFVDFRKFNERFPNVHEHFFLKGFGHLSFQTEWTKLFDAEIFIRKMYPCEKN